MEQLFCYHERAQDRLICGASEQVEKRRTDHTEHVPERVVVLAQINHLFKIVLQVPRVVDGGDGPVDHFAHLEVLVQNRSNVLVLQEA